MIRFYTYPNPTTTATDAPFLGRVVPNGVVNRNDLIAEIKSRIATTDARVIAHIEEAIAVAIEKAKLGYTIDFGFMKFVPHITGSVECVDTPWAANVQKFVFDGYGNADLRNCLDNIAPTRIDGSDLASKIRVDNIEDLDSKRIGVIVGTKQFVITGNGMTVDSEGEGVKLLNKKTLEVVQAATIVSVSKGQRAYCKFATAPAAGKYYIEVKTKGLVGLDTPVPFRKPITVETDPTPPAPQPTLTKAYPRKDPTNEGYIYCNNEYNAVEGMNLGNVTTVTVWKNPDNPVTCTNITATGDKVEFNLDDSNLAGSELTIKVEGDDGSAEITAVGEMWES